MPPPADQSPLDPGLAAQRLVRFDAVQRAAHWATALLFAVLMVTALALYFGSLASLIGRRELVAQIHLWAGLVLPLPVLVALAGPWGARLRRDLRRVNLWTSDELRWLRALGRDAPRVVDKFNPGQKMNAIFTGGATVVLLATGAIMKWFGPFPLSWRTGATFVHDLLALAVFLVVAGHVTLALTHPDSMRSMLTGWVSRAWAARHAPAWLAEETTAPPEIPGGAVALPLSGPSSAVGAPTTTGPGPGAPPG